LKRQRATGWAARLARGWWPDRNPVRRHWDRVEAAIVAALIAGFLAGAPLAALAADGWAHSEAQHVQQAQQAGWHRVPAVLTARAPSPADSGYVGEVLSQVPARWTAPGGTKRTGLVLAAPGAAAGSQVMVWVNEAGQLTGPPLRDHQVAEQAVLAGVVAAAFLGLALLCAGLFARRMLDARRIADWDAEWRVTGPRWSPHR
jgi:hypothetical protein